MDLKLESIDQLWLVVIFVLPGFIAFSAYSRFISRGARNQFVEVMECLAVSAVNFAVFGPVFGILWPIFAAYHLGLLGQYALGFTYVFIIPVAQGITLARLVRQRDSGNNLKPWWLKSLEKVSGGSLSHHSVRGWDYVMGSGKTFWLVITLKSGERIPGYFGAKSLAAAYPTQSDIYLERVYEFDTDGSLKESGCTGEGIWIDGAEIRHIEFLASR